jgi:vacuolar-type H+-ATPase subunit E/Vma4
MFGDFNQTILLKAKEWLTPAAIKEYLIACITTIPELFGEKKTLIVHLNEPDLELVSGLFEELLGDYTVQYRPDCSDAIGGMTVEDSERRIFCDFTIKNLIESQQKLIGMTLNNFMDSKVN